MYQESVYHCYLLQNRTVKTAWHLEEVEALQEAMGPLEALIFQHSSPASTSVHSLEQATAAVDTLPCPGLAILATAGVTALAALLKEEIVWVSHEV